MKYFTRSLHNETGALTFDFLFAFIMVMGFAALLFALSMTLTVVEITQYMTFASARNYAAAHITPADQQQQAVAKFNQLRESREFGNLFTNGWFSLDDATPGDYSQSGAYAQDLLGGQGENYNTFQGVVVELNARMLDFNIPFYGSTNTNDDGRGFVTQVSSFLSREVTSSECTSFTQQRWEAIKNLDSDYGNGSSSETDYAVITDNGC